MTKTLLQPAGWARPKGYANGISASGRYVFTAGLIGWNADQVFEARDFLGQFRQTLMNVKAVLAEAGATPDDLVRLTCYLTDKREYLDHLDQVGAIWRDVFGKVFPCMAVVQVSALMEDDAKVEIEATAIVSDGEPRSEQ